MRHAFKRFRFIAWAVMVSALYAIANPRTVWRMIASRNAHRDSRPDTGLSGAGVLAPVHPPPPIIVASMAKELPRTDDDET